MAKILAGKRLPRAEAEALALESLATRAAKKLKNEESLLVQMGAVRLRTELDRVPLWAGNHVGIKQLAEYMARYLYLPRLRDENVMFAAIQEGVASLMWQAETFAYAEGWDEQRNRYQGLRAATTIRVIADDRTVLVKPDAAAAQFAADRQAAGAGAAPTTSASTTVSAAGPNGSDGTPASTLGGPTGVAPAAPALRRFPPSASSALISRVISTSGSDDTGQVLYDLLGDASGVPPQAERVHLHGAVASDKTVRDVTENCRTLKFTDFGFEEQ